MSDGEMKQIQGVCSEISEKNDWTTFLIDVGTQYPVRLNTKLPVLIEQGRAARGQQAVWTYKESQGNPNPNRPGSFYMNRYLERVEVGGQMTIQSSPSGGTAQAAPVRDQGTNRSIERQTIIKAMVPIYPVETPQTDSWWWTLLGKLDDFCVKGVPRPQQAQQPAVGSGGGSYERDDYVPESVLEQQAATTHPDDDIPF